MVNYKATYFLKHDIFGEKEVSKEDFIKAERAAGFYPKSGRPDDCATGGFGQYGGLSGYIKYSQEEE